MSDSHVALVLNGVVVGRLEHFKDGLPTWDMSASCQPRTDHPLGGKWVVIEDDQSLTLTINVSVSIDPALYPTQLAQAARYMQLVAMYARRKVHVRLDQAGAVPSEYSVGMCYCTAIAKGEFNGSAGANVVFTFLHGASGMDIVNPLTNGDFAVPYDDYPGVAQDWTESEADGWAASEGGTGISRVKLATGQFGLLVNNTTKGVHQTVPCAASATEYDTVVAYAEIVVPDNNSKYYDGAGGTWDQASDPDAKQTVEIRIERLDADGDPVTTSKDVFGITANTPSPVVISTGAHPVAGGSLRVGIFGSAGCFFIVKRIWIEERPYNGNVDTGVLPGAYNHYEWWSYSSEGIAAAGAFLDQVYTADVSKRVVIFSGGVPVAPTGADLVLELYDNNAATGETITCLAASDPCAASGVVAYDLAAGHTLRVKIVSVGSTFAGERPYANIRLAY